MITAPADSIKLITKYYQAYMWIIKVYIILWYTIDIKEFDKPELRRNPQIFSFDDIILKELLQNQPNLKDIISIFYMSPLQTNI